jgi:hypothetical protein
VQRSEPLRETLPRARSSELVIPDARREGETSKPSKLLITRSRLVGALGNGVLESSPSEHLKKRLRERLRIQSARLTYTADRAAPACANWVLENLPQIPYLPQTYL